MRIRTIKPEFFRHEQLALLSHKTRLLFIGLWCIADKEGRLEDRPQRIRIEIFPYETESIEGELQELCSSGFIARYSAQGADFIEVTAFSKHQRITGKEAKYVSKIPPRCDTGSSGETPEQQQALLGCVTGAQERKKEKGEKERKKVPRFSPDEHDALLSNAMRANAEFLQEWHRWNTYRNKKRKRISEDAAKEQIRNIHSSGIAAGIAAIRKSIASDWQGLFLDDAVGQTQKPSTPVRTMQDLITAGELKPIYRGPCPGLYADEDGANV